MAEQKLLKRKIRAQEENNQSLLASTCSDLAQLYHDESQYEKAKSEYKEQAEINDVMGKKLEYGICHRMAGEMAMLLGKYEDALHHETIYLKVAKELDNQIEEQRAYATIGRVYLLQGQSLMEEGTATKHLHCAEKTFIKSLLKCKELTREIKGSEVFDMQARLFLNLGVTKENLAEYEEAAQYMQKAISMCQKYELYELLHQCYMAYGLMVHLKQNNTPQALKLFKIAHDVAERLPNKSFKMCESLVAESDVHIKNSNFVGAVECLKKALCLKIADASERKHVEQTLRCVIAITEAETSLTLLEENEFQKRKLLYEKIGDGCCQLQTYPKAIDCYLNMLENANLNGETGRDLMSIFVSLYQTYKDNKQYSMSADYGWKEYEICQNFPREAYNTLMNIAEVYELDNRRFWDVEEVLQRARKEAQKTNSTKLESNVIMRLLALQNKHKMVALAEILRREAESSGFKIDENEIDVDTEDDSQNLNTPLVGEDIDLEQFIDIGNDCEETVNPRPQRRKNGFILKKNNKGETALHQACIAGNIGLVERLLEQGHPIDIRDNAGWLPLHEACNNGHLDIVRLILDKGGKSTINDKGGTNCDGITPLHDAAVNGHIEIIEVLLQQGANVTARTDCGDTVLDSLLKWRASADLDSCELVDFERIRARIADSLSRAGIMTSSHSTVPESPQKLNDHQKMSPLFQYTRRKPKHDMRNKLSSNSDSDGDSDQGGLRNKFPNDSYGSPTDGKRENGKQEYKQVMEELRRRNCSDGTGWNESTIKKRSAYLDSLDVADDWLENNLAPVKKKRKHFYDPAIDTTSSLRKNSPIKKRNIPIYPLNDLAENSIDRYSLDVLMGNVSSSRDQQKPAKRVKSFSRLSLSNPHIQSSLLDAGFCRQRRESVSSPVNLPDSTSTSSVIESPTSGTNVTAQNSNSISILTVKVRIEGQLFVVPINRSELDLLTFKWLGESASKRYYNIKSIRPELRLTTLDGAVYESTDPLSVLEPNTVIDSTVLEWILPSLSQRYLENCDQSRIEKDDSLFEKLETAQSSQSLCLANEAISETAMRTILKSIPHQHSLVVLNLSNNLIENENVKLLAQALPTLRQLEVLDLSSNLISHEGVDQLSLVFEQKIGVLRCLRDVNFSFNPLGNESLRALSTFCKSLEKLSHLSLSSCDITELTQLSINFDVLELIDVSHNQLQGFRVLQSSRSVVHLNLSFCLRNNGTAEEMLRLFENSFFENIKSIDLSGNQLTDADLWQLLQALTKFRSLKRLKLQQSDTFTFTSFKNLLKHPNTLELIDLIGSTSVLAATNFNTACQQSYGSTCHEQVTLSLPQYIEKSIIIEQLKKFWGAFCGNERKLTVNKNNTVSLLCIK